LTSIALRSHTPQTYTLVSQAKSITIPAGTTAGDLMLLHYVGSVEFGGTISGWTKVQEGQGGSVFATLYSRTAIAGDATSTVTVPATGAGNAKTSMILDVYSGVSSSSPIAASAMALETASGTTHSGAALTLPGSFVGWVVRFLGLKDTSTAPSTTYTPPSGYVVDDRALSAGTSQTVSVTADSSADVTTYSAGSWTVDSATANAVTMAVALAGATTTSLVRPSTDVLTAGWTPATGTAIYPMLASNDPTAYAVGSGALEVGFTGLTGVPTAFNVSKVDVGGVVNDSTLFELRQGSTVIASRTSTTIDSTVTGYRFLLTGAERAAINASTLGDIRVRITPSVS